MDEQKKAISLAVGNQIRRYRYAKSISQEDLALRANINPAYLGQVERGLKCPTVDTLCKLSTALEILPSELLQFNSFQDSDAYFNRRAAELISKIPTEKKAQVLQILEEISSLC